VAKFQFKLQPVLDQRERIERDRMLAVARVQSERSALENQLREFQAAIMAQKGDLRSAMAGDGAGGGAIIDPAKLRVQAHASLTLQVKAQRVVLQLAGLHKRLEVAQAALAAAARDRRAVEVLKERRFARWKAEEDRRAGVALDEMVTSRAARSRQSADDHGIGGGTALTEATT